MEPAPVAVILSRMAVIAWFVIVFAWFFDPAGFVLGAYVLGMAVLGAIVGTTVYGLTLFLKSQVNRTSPTEETRKRIHESLDLLADERRRDKIFGVQKIQSFQPDFDGALHREAFSTR
jgi:disulfide bond formation protein DsbB